MWEYQAQLDHSRTGVVDGDTIDLVVDVGFYCGRRVRVRLKGVDTAEIYGYPKESDEYQEGMEHKQFVETWIETAQDDHAGPWPLVVVTEQAQGKYGRWIADIKRKCDDSVLGEDLIEEYPSVQS